MYCIYYKKTNQVNYGRVCISVSKKAGDAIVRNKIKRQIREMTKRLQQLNYTEEKLSQKVEQNIDFAKRHLVDTIYKQAILEGVATTFADTESIIEGGKVNNMTTEDIMKIVNLKHA